MAEDWDLSAVVRGCRSSSSAAAAATTTTITAPSSSSSSKEVSSPLIRQENDVFSFPSLIEPTTNGFRELHQLFKPFIPTTTTTIISTSGCGIYPNSSFTDFAVAGSSSNHNNNNNNNNINTTSSSSSLVASVSVSSSYASNISRPPHFMPQASPSTSSSSGFQRFHDQHVQKLQQQKQIQDQLQQLVHHQKQQFQTPPGQISGGGDVNNNSGMTLPNTQAPQATTRSRKRKSQQKRMVCHVTAENLTADSWAWRKYGQKPIKGSPYPRNYYRCSSSKGCGARKQVERSNTEPDMFIVTYTGEHTHPRPTHRNSLAGSTRNKPSAAAIRQPLSHEPGSPSNTANNRASSSSQLSPTTPLTAVATNDECADELMLSNEATSPFPDEDELDLASHDDILIPNMAAMMDKFLLGAGELHGIGLSGGGGGGHNTSGNPADGSYTNTEPGLTPNLQQHFSPLSRSSPG